MEFQEIEVIIEKDGTVRIEVRGVKGQACLELTAALEQALGGELTAREMTPEALETPLDLDQDQQLYGKA